MDGFPAHADDSSTAQFTPAYPHCALLNQAILDRATTGLMGFDVSRCVVLCNHFAADMLGMAMPETWSSVPIDQMLAQSTKLDGAGRLALKAALHPGDAPACLERRNAGDRLAKITLADGRTLYVTISEVAGRKPACHPGR